MKFGLNLVLDGNSGLMVLLRFTQKGPRGAFLRMSICKLPGKSSGGKLVRAS